MPILLSSLAALLLSLVLAPLVRNVARYNGWLDHPDQNRKHHPKPIPRLGGVSIFLAYLAAVWLAPGAQDTILHLLPAAALIFLTGLYDDLRGLNPWAKLTAQFAAASLAWASGIQLTGLQGFPLPYWLTFPATVFWLLACTNAINLIDGMDGLAGGISLFATLTILAAALLSGNTELALATAPLAGALIGFLRYNFNLASIFLGDCGSLTIGFLLGCFGILWSHKSATLFAMTAPLMVFALPLADTALAVARRLIRRQPVFSGDTRHIHHQLLRRGLTTRRALLLLYAASGAAAALALLQTFLHDRYGLLIIAVFLAAAWFGLAQLGYVEFAIARTLIVRGNFRSQINAHVNLQAFQDRLTAAQDLDDCWNAILEILPAFGFHEAQAHLQDRRFTLESPHPAHWQVIIKIPDHGQITLSRTANGTYPPCTPFLDALGQALTAKLNALSTASPFIPMDPVHPR